MGEKKMKKEYQDSMDLGSTYYEVQGKRTEGGLANIKRFYVEEGKRVELTPDNVKQVPPNIMNALNTFTNKQFQKFRPSTEDRIFRISQDELLRGYLKKDREAA